MRNWLKSILRRPKNRIQRVIIFGTHTPDWMEALLPQAAVWRELRASRTLQVEHIAEERLAEIANCRSDTVIVPLMEAHIAACLHSPLKAAALLPSAEALEILRDKARFAAYTESHSLARFCPRIFLSPGSAEFPCVLKRTDLNGGAGIDIATSPAHLEELLKQELWKERPVLLQQLISGQDEHVAHCVCKNGKILWHCVYQYILDPANPIRRGINLTRRAAVSRKQLKQIQRFLRPLKYTGPCNVDFKISDTRDIVVFEINPRLGGSLMRPENNIDLWTTIEHILNAAEA
ncbi:MAG: ATP-grasp domain-containing protein [Oligoflexia bacterium]|nr:ATP-grasp domain-containing protein [Oligoflexia bacterium]